MAVFRTAVGAAGSYVTYVSSWKNGCQNFSYGHRSRKHWDCKYFFMNRCQILDFILRNVSECDKISKLEKYEELKL